MARIRGQPRHGVSCGSALLSNAQGSAIPVRGSQPQPQCSVADTSTIACSPQIKGHSVHVTWQGIIFMVFQRLQIRNVLIVNQGNCSSDLTTPLRRARAQKSNQISSGSWVAKQDYFVAEDSLFSNFAEDSSAVLGYSSPRLYANSSRITDQHTSVYAQTPIPRVLFLPFRQEVKVLQVSNSYKLFFIFP